MAQKDTNPYIYSDSNKRYMTYDWYMKQRFGGKIAKIPLDIGCTCPNIDGTCGRGGCIYCKSGSRSAVGADISDQYENGLRTAQRKWKPAGYIPYLQSNTNTYGDIGRLKPLYEQAAALPGTSMLDIATRADCLGEDVLRLLEDTARSVPLTVELGLQTSDDLTAVLINRGHSFSEFVKGYTALRDAADRINSEFGSSAFGNTRLRFKRFTICIHLINGLPGENRETMVKSIRDVSALKPDMVKLHLLHVLRGTGMEKMLTDGDYIPIERDEYVNTVCDQIELLPPETVIARVTGDGVADELLAPEWSRRKTEVTNEIDKELYRRSSYQGISYRD